mgnify:CR=1 FL=1
MKNPKNYTEDDWRIVTAICIWSNILYWAYKFFI